MLKRIACATWLSVFSLASYAHQGHEHEAHQHHHEQAQVAMVHDAYIREWLPAAPSTAAYFSIHNQGETPLKLVKASVEGVGRVEIHEHQHVNGMMKMQQVEDVTIAAGKTVTFQPGGYHLMLFSPSQPITKGQALKLTLYFADGNRIYTVAPVTSVMESASNAEHHHH
ncbi:copper chaperone PCu(A)C [Pseudoalteromonas fenneropenaei]|uniref:Copper chaperone PCu(A)C n=1 Tax=Pseudoalteromonas fenneropenaei TaxID=1737459 RepID=A0ABV7CM39_9GAMM